MSKTAEKSLEVFQEATYGRLDRLTSRWCHWLKFTRCGSERLTKIAGWLTGLAHAGQTELAEKLATSFITEIDNLHQDVVFYEDTPYPIRVPARKYVFSDDGTFNSFGVIGYYAINPDKVLESVRKVQGLFSAQALERLNNVENLALQRVAHAAIRVADPSSVPEKYDLSESLWQHPKCGTIYYGGAYSAGFIYHGPGKGETFSVTLDSSRDWQLHT
jgi:hypothetical protein